MGLAVEVDILPTQLACRARHALWPSSPPLILKQLASPWGVEVPSCAEAGHSLVEAPHSPARADGGGLEQHALVLGV